MYISSPPTRPPRQAQPGARALPQPERLDDAHVASLYTTNNINYTMIS